MNRRKNDGHHEPGPDGEDRSRAAARSWGNQIIGALIGGGIALLLAVGAREVGWISGGLIRYVLWGGVIGGLIGGSDALAQAGKRLTHRDETWLNVIVALVGMAVVFGIVFLVAYGVSLLVRRFAA